MKTYLDCIPCFLKQGLNAAQNIGLNETAQKRILNEICRIIPDFPLSSPPPAMAIDIYRIIREISGKEDPFLEIKERSNEFALKLYPSLKQRVLNSEDGLLTATQLAIVGNLIDYGVPRPFNLEKEINKGLKRNFAICDYEEFRESLEMAEYVLYIGDNAGEVVFDRVLIEELSKMVIYAVRGSPIINDCLMNDAIHCGVEKAAGVISTESDAPGTILKRCSHEFQRTFKNAGLIISKGQGNFETLSDEEGPLFFFFMVKCEVVAGHIGCRIGDAVLMAKKIRE